MGSEMCIRDRYDTDFLSPRRGVGWASSFDWKQLLATHQLQLYDILIFNREWNRINAFNERGFDGTAYNAWPPLARVSRRPEYMLRLKRYRG